VAVEHTTSLYVGLVTLHRILSVQITCIYLQYTLEWPDFIQM